MKTARPIGLRFYFSFRSPYSWIAARLLPRRLPASLHGRIEYVPFWEPDAKYRQQLLERGKAFLYQPMSSARHLYILQDVRRLAREQGIAMRWPVDDPNPWWERPHLAWLAASRAGKGATCLEAIYRARWERGENICSEATIARVAGDIGLDPDSLLQAPGDEAIQALALEALQSCIATNAFGVPFFVAGREQFWGQDRLDDFVQHATQTVHAERTHEAFSLEEAQ